MTSASTCSAVLRPMPRLPPVMSAIRVMPATISPAGAREKRSAQPGTSRPWLSPRARPILEPVDRQALADFLRRRREALRPEDVGLSQGRRRRTAGLRREEVALLAHMSTDFYARLEQQ